MFFKRLCICCAEYFSFFKVMLQLMYGAWKMSSVPFPRVTIFGGSRVGQKTKFAQDAFDLAQMLVHKGISVITGGGGGVMHAANCGAIAKKTSETRSVGIGVTEIGEGRNPCVQDYFQLKYFFARKWMLTRYSMGFIIFPGGFGTMDELAEVLTLVATKKLDRVPIIMVGKEYWKDFMEWLDVSALAHGLVSKEDLALFTLTDGIEQACEIIEKECDRIMVRKKQKS